MKFLNELSLPLTRESDDTHRANRWGNNILDLCINTQSVICNGRFGPKSSKCTTIHSTTVDYGICSLEFLKYIKSMQILDFNNCLSDVHNPLEITLLCFKAKKERPAQTERVESGMEGCRIGRWDQNKVNDFVAHFNINNIRIKINPLLTDFDRAENQQERIDDVMNTINDTFIQSGYDTFGKKPLSSNNNARRRKLTQTNKPWYNTICRNKKIIFNQARKKYQITRKETDFILQKQAGKEYKKEILKAHTTHSDKIRMEVRHLRNLKNKGAFWDYCKQNKKTIWPPKH